ncbi:MAG: flippase-like domain-containing protein [Leptolyngbyaceae cyanobacterium MAG.088]|nr:flippase-like domain-containing protein [Leptolyngbyaceae cyanobacterium MAG.088]
MVNRILRWFLFGGIIFFLAKTLKDHWQEVRSLEITGATLALLTIALGITLIAHIWSGWVWHLILKVIGQPRDGRWTTMIYLKTNIAKYLPGNVWHFFGRVRALQSSGASTGAAIVGVVLEPLLMAAAALGLAAISLSIAMVNNWPLLVLSLAALVAMLVAIHPRFLNPILQKLGKAKARSQGMTVITSTLRLNSYPWRSLLGELGFVVLRGLGFVMTIVALEGLKPSQFLPIMGAFSIAWLMGLVVPGAPGGVGVFEAVAIAILGNQLPSGLLISSVALYRLISTLAEALGAGLIWLEERLAELMSPMTKVKRRLLLLPPTQDEELSQEEQPSALLSPGPDESAELAAHASSEDSSAPESDTFVPDVSSENSSAPESDTFVPDVSSEDASALNSGTLVPDVSSEDSSALNSGTLAPDVPSDASPPVIGRSADPAEISYVVSSSRAAASETLITTEESGADTLNSDEPGGVSSGESQVYRELDKTGPRLPSFVPKSLKGDGEPSSQSLSPRNNG